MKLYGTFPSHFTRKARVVLHELGLPFEFAALEVESLMKIGAENFGRNPLHQIPVLEDGERRIFESDLICEYLFEKYGDRNPSLTLFPPGNRLDHKIRLAVINGFMGSGVKLIRAKRSGISWDTVLCQQELASLTAALAWLDQDLGAKNSYHPGGLTLLDISLVCAMEWALFREMIPTLAEYPSLARFVEANRARPSFASTHPSAPRKP